MVSWARTDLNRSSLRLPTTLQRVSVKQRFFEAFLPELLEVSQFLLRVLLVLLFWGIYWFLLTKVAEMR
jgi:hypothetical protein